MKIDDEKKIDAEKCLQVAETAFAAGKLDKAERMLLKAERLYPTFLAKQMLDDIKVARGIEINSEAVSDTSSFASGSSESYYRSEYDEKEAERYVEMALEAIEKGKLYRARRFLLKSIRIFPNEMTKEILNDIGDENFSFTTFRAKQVVRNEEEADKCTGRAEAEIEKGRLGKAEQLLKKAERLCPSIRAKDLLRQVEAAKGFKGEWNEERERKKSRESRQQQNQGRQQEKPKRNEPTPEQLVTIERLKGGKNDDEILGLEDKCPTSTVTNAYSKLTLLPEERTTVSSKQKEQENPEIIENANNETAIKYMKEAAKFFIRGNVDATEKLLVEANSINSNKKIQDFLELIRQEKAMEELQKNSELKPEEKFDQREEAMKCVNMAMTAMVENNIEEAERLLTKAIRFHPSKRTQDFLETFLIAKEKRMNKEALAENYLKRARTVLTQNNFDLAEEYATISEALNPSVRAKGLLEDIAQSRNNGCSHLPSGTVYKTSDLSFLKSSELKNKAEKFVEEAEKSYVDGKIEEAKLFLRDAESLHLTKRATILSQLIQEAKKNPEILENLKKEKTKKYVKEAGEFYSKGDLDTAENLLVEANNTNFTEKIQDFLEKIRHEKAMKEAKEFQSKLKLKPEEKFDQREQEAMRCVKMAKTAMAENNIEKSERLLRKAMRLHPSKTTQDYLETVLIAKEKRMNEEAEAAASAAKEATATEKELHEILLLVNSFVNSGLDAYNAKKYYAAEQWFKKAYNVHPTNLATDYLLRIKKMIPGNSKEQANPLKEKEIIDELDIYITIADKNLKDNNIKVAFANILKAENLRATDKGYQLLLRILEAEYYKINGPPQKVTKRNYELIQMKSFKAKRLFDVGEQAFSCKHFQMAEYYFCKSSEMFPSVKAKIRKLEAEQAKKKKSQEGWTVWDALKYF